MAKIVIDNKEYNVEDLNDTAKAQIANIQYVDAKIRDLQSQIAVMNAAKAYYLAILKQNLPQNNDEKIKFEDE
jgi:hypothetical protein